MKEKLEIRLQQLREEYDHELKTQGSGDFASMRAAELHGEIMGILWALKLFEE